MRMNCQEKTTLKLSSNIVSKELGNGKLGVYIPVDLKLAQYRDARLRDCLSERQKVQADKQLFFADEVITDLQRYPMRKENLQMCKDCEYKDICY